MNRRDFLKLLGISSGASILGYGVTRGFLAKNTQINIHYPGMESGHRFRDGVENLEVQNEYDSDITIVGSGISGLSCAFKLVKEKFKGRITLITGPELFGNSADIEINGNLYPTGAHYLPLQTVESTHVREILSQFNIILKDPYSEYPTYNEKDLVYSPMERFLYNNEWTEGNHQHNKHFDELSNLVNRFKGENGNDGKPLFTFPVEKSSIELQSLDKIKFSDWIENQGMNYPDVISYLNYCIRDDYGVNIDQISAFAGILYFAGRNGKAKNISEDTMMTWENGNAHIAKLMFEYIRPHVNIVNGIATEVDKGYIKYFDGKSIAKINSPKIVLATPLFISNRILKNNKINQNLIPNYSTWIISNFLFDELPYELFKGVGLAYDNTIYQSENLGYIYSSNQSLDISRENKVITTYTNIPTTNSNETRKVIKGLSKEELFKISSRDLISSFGETFFRKLKSCDITIRGHAMSAPEVGFLEKNDQIKDINDKLSNDGILLSHSDMSRISVFEEASYHGFKAAYKILMS